MVLLVVLHSENVFPETGWQTAPGTAISRSLNSALVFYNHLYLINDVC